MRKNPSFLKQTSFQSLRGDNPKKQPYAYAGEIGCREAVRKRAGSVITKLFTAASLAAHFTGKAIGPIRGRRPPSPS